VLTVVGWRTTKMTTSTTAHMRSSYDLVLVDADAQRHVFCAIRRSRLSGIRGGISSRAVANEPAVDPMWLLRTNLNKVGVLPWARPRERQAALDLMCGTFADGAPTAGGLRSA
jgi:hypothetical protein